MHVQFTVRLELRLQERLTLVTPTAGSQKPLSEVLGQLLPEVQSGGF